MNPLQGKKKNILQNQLSYVISGCNYEVSIFFFNEEKFV